MKTILAIGTHPDDIEIGCGGTLALLQQQGYRICHLIVTSGEEGSLQIPLDELAATRESEARAAAQILGTSDVFFMREPDGLTHFTKAMKQKLISMLRDIRPQIVFTHAKSDHFPDHRVIHELTLSALAAAAGPWYPGGGPGKPHSVEDVYGYEVWNPIPEPALFVDITSTMEQKLTALQAHRSQIQDVDYVGAVQGLARYRGAMARAGKAAEAFEVLQQGTIR